MSDRGETTAELIEAARSAGVAVSADQLKRLRRAGLIPRPRQTHTAGTVGSSVRYPTGTADALIRVLHIRAGRRSKPLSAVRFIAWEEGLPVTFSMLRSDVVRMVRETTRPFAGTRDDDQLARRLRAHHVEAFEGPGSAPSPDVDPEDLALATMQIAAGTPHSEIAWDTFDRAFPPRVLTPDNETPISDVVDQLGLPPMGQWPRILSRSNAAQFEVGRQAILLMNAYTIVTGRSFGDSDRGLARRALTAAAYIVGVKTNPEALEALTNHH